MARNILEQGVPTKKTQAAVTKSGPALRRYQDVMVGQRSILAIFYYEWCCWLSAVPGALGIGLRKIFWPRLLGSCGRGVLFGQNVILRHPHRIHLGNRAVVSDGCILDARNEESDQVITVQEDVILSNNVMISCKSGTVSIGPRTGLGAQTIIHSATGCSVMIGADVMIGPQCYLVCGSNHNIDRLDIPMWQQGIKPDSGITLEDDIWLGAHVTVLGGVTIGTGSVVGAGAVVTKSVPARAICMGIPAKITRMRGEQ